MSISATRTVAAHTHWIIGIVRWLRNEDGDAIFGEFQVVGIRKLVDLKITTRSARLADGNFS